MSEQARNWLLGAVGVSVLLAACEVIGQTGAAGRTFPPISEVFEYGIDPSRRSLFQRAIGATFQSAWRGFAIGTVFAVVIAGIGTLIPLLKEGIDRFAASVHAIPLIALGPLFIVAMSRANTPTAIAALATYFPVYVASVSGFEAASRAHLDVFAVLGADRRTRFRRLQMPAALPAFSDGLRLAAPAAVLGAILGEWFGAPRGIGILIVSSMQNFQIRQLWVAALLAALVSMVAFALFGALERFVVARFR